MQAIVAATPRTHLDLVVGERESSRALLVISNIYDNENPLMICQRTGKANSRVSVKMTNTWSCFVFMDTPKLILNVFLGHVAARAAGQ